MQLDMFKPLGLRPMGDGHRPIVLLWSRFVQCAELSCRCRIAYAGHNNGPISLIQVSPLESTNQNSAACISSYLLTRGSMRERKNGDCGLQQITEVSESQFIVKSSFFDSAVRP